MARFKINRLPVSMVVAAVLVLVGSFAFAYHIAGSTNASQATAAQSRCPVDACISLDSTSAEPQTITVKTGSYVQFNTADGKKHNLFLAHSGVQHHDHSRYESGDFGSGEAWKVQIREDGSYSFADKYHQSVKVSIVAYTPGKEYKIQ